MANLQFERKKVIGTVLLVAALFTPTGANGPSGSYPYGGYGQQVQQQQQYQQPDRWYSEPNQASSVAQPSASTPDSGPAPEESEKPPLPDGWTEHFDPNSGQNYYYNAADGTTSWDRPQAPEAEEPVLKESETKVEEPVASEQSAGVATTEPEKQEPSEDISSGAPSADSSSPPPETQNEQNTWGQNQYPQDRWSSTQSSGQDWGQSNSTEPEVKKAEFDGPPQQPEPQQQAPPAAWGVPQQPKVDQPPSNPAQPWGVPKPQEQHSYNNGPPKQQQAPERAREAQAPPSGSSNTGPWGVPKSAENPPPKTNDAPPTQGQTWNQPPPMTNQNQPPAQQGPPQNSRPPAYHQRQYPPPGAYPPPGQGQYDPRYGNTNPYQRGYPPQQYPPQQPGAGQLVAQDTGPSAVQEALTNSWGALLSFGSRTKEAVGSARNQVVSSATEAGKSISEKGSSFWETAKSTVGGVFESNEASPPSTYNLGGQPSPPGYPGRPSGPNPGYGPGGPGGRGPPPRTFGGPQQPPGRYGPPPGQQPRYGAPPQSGSVQPPGRQQPPAPHQHSQQPPRQPGNPNMQPRRDAPYPQTPNGQQRGPMQARYGSQQPPPGQYPPQQRPPYSPPSGGPPNGGPQGGPPQEKPSDPWDHPALTGDY